MHTQALAIIINKTLAVLPSDVQDQDNALCPSMVALWSRRVAEQEVSTTPCKVDLLAEPAVTHCRLASMQYVRPVSLSGWEGGGCV